MLSRTQHEMLVQGHGWVDEWMDGWTDGWINFFVSCATGSLNYTSVIKYGTAKET